MAVVWEIEGSVIRFRGPHEVRAFSAAVKADPLNGVWDGDSKVWWLKIEHERRLRKLIAAHFPKVVLDELDRKKRLAAMVNSMLLSHKHSVAEVMEALHATATARGLAADAALFEIKRGAITEDPRRVRADRVKHKGSVWWRLEVRDAGGIWHLDGFCLDEETAKNRLDALEVV